MKLIQFDKPRYLFIHLAIILTITALLIISFFYAYLPAITNKGETITVRNLIGMSINDIEQTLSKNGLRFEVNDSSYSEKYPPMTVLKQYPKPGSKVKENRKIFVSINRITPPMVKMPQLNGTLKNAELILESVGLKLGNKTYENHRAHNYVLRRYYDGEVITEGEQIPKGSSIDLVLGNGSAPNQRTVENYTGKSFEEMRILIKGQDLLIGKVDYSEVDSLRDNLIVIKQHPAPGESINRGDEIDLWVAEGDPVDSEESDDDFQ